jgi:carbon-monoxide dehydrogenase small subunit
MERVVHLTVNGDEHSVAVRPNVTLLELLRDHLGLTGAKRGCDFGDCGTCTVLLDGKAVKSCLVLAVAADGHEVTTIEGLEENGRMHPLQKAFIAAGAIQCGYCTPGMVMAATSLLDENPHPTEEEVRLGLEGNLCRCTGYHNIVKAVLAAASTPA